MATIAEFEEIRRESQLRLLKALQTQNEAAKKRNKEFLEEVLVDKDNCKPQITLHSSSRLLDEKARFSKYIESSYSALQRNKNRLMEEQIAEIKMEKLAAAQRREKLRIQMLRENATKYELEKQRRELMMTYALEQREILEANAQAVLLSEEGRIVDQSILNSVQNYSEDLKSIVADKLVHAGETSGRIYKFPQRSLSINGGFLGGYNTATFENHQAIYQQQQQQQQGQKMFNDEHFSGIRPSAIEEARQQYGGVSASVTKFPIARDMDPSVMRSPRELMSNNNLTASTTGATATAASTNFSFNISPSHTQATRSPRVNDRLDTASKPLTDGDEFESQLSYSRISDSIHDTAIRPSTEFSHRLDSAAGYGTTTVSDPFALPEPATSLPGNTIESLHLASTLSNHSHRSLEHSVLPTDTTAGTSVNHNPSIHLSKEDGKDDNSTTTKLTENISEEKKEMEPLAGDLDEFEESLESSTAPAVVPELSLAVTLQILRNLLPIAENSVLFASVQDVYKPSTVHAMPPNEHSVSVRLIEQVVADVASNAVQSSGGPADDKKGVTAGYSAIGYAIQLIIQSKAAALIPIGAFAGVVTIDKLKKEYKKTIPGGTQLQELWDLLSSHMQTLMESNSAHLDYISNIFTEMYIHHVPEDDKDRLRRKVSKLLQLAMLPQSSAENSRSSSPTERYINNSNNSVNLSFQLPQTSFASNPIPTAQPPLSIRKTVDTTSNASSSAAASTTAGTATSYQANSSNNANQRVKYQDSIDFEEDDDDPLFSSTTSTSKLFSQFGTSTSRPPSSSLVIGGKSGQVGYVSSVLPGGSGEMKLPAAGISQFFLGGGNSSSTVDKKRATEFDDDEIMDDDEEIQRPPPLRDLDAENISNRNTATSTTAARGGGAVKTTTSTIVSSWGQGSSSNNDEFDF